MVKKKSKPHTKNLRYSQDWTVTALVTILLAAGVIKILLPHKVITSVEPAVSMWPSPTPVASSKPSVIKTYTSQKLGVRFKYLLEANDMSIIEEGNKIYVWGKNGQWVEMFSKNPADNLKTAIKKRFLVGISEQDCPVVDYEDIRPSGKESKTPNIETAEIKLGFQFDINDSRALQSPCPTNYRHTNGVRYFYMNKNYPNKFFFFEIGQYLILAEPEKSIKNTYTEKGWQDTFEVFR